MLGARPKKMMNMYIYDNRFRASFAYGFRSVFKEYSD